MATNKPINTTSIEAGSFDGNLMKDIQGFRKQPNQWPQARNAVTNTIRGDLGGLSNEMANYLCTKAPYTIIGIIHIQSDEWAIFSTDDVNSEIGIFKESNCQYQKIVNAPCLNFKKNHLIIGVGRSTHDCGRRVYWDDGVNPSRVLNLDKVPWQQNCNAPTQQQPCVECEDLSELDCDKLRLAPIVRDLSFIITPGNSSGQLLNGSYYVLGAYLVEGQRVTDYSLPSNIQGLFRHSNLASSLDIHVTEADPEFDEFELIVVQFANFNTVAKKVGVYSTRQKKITLDHIDEKWESLDPGLFLIHNNIPDRSDAIYRVGDYLMRVGPSDKFDFNYQPLANQIVTRWVSVEYPAEYYRKGGYKTGYMRDEVYSFFIRFVFNTGDRSKSYHIPGRAPVLSDLSPITGDDVLYDNQGNLIDNPVKWEVYNTAVMDLSYPDSGVILEDGGKILGAGYMGYWQSTELYPDNKPEIWNASSNPIWNSTNPNHDLCGKPIRHHKFPDNGLDTLTGDIITNHYSPNDGEKIRIMGVQFDNIKLPLDNDGNVLSNIVGYEILRGSREGNKVVLAKGMINNLREYMPIDQNPTKRYLYPNYPYNPTKKNFIFQNQPVAADHFLSSTHTQYNSGAGIFGFNPSLNNYNAYLKDDIPTGITMGGTLGPDGQAYFIGNTNIKKDLLTFHSPETNFRNPFLSAKELKVYGELHGTMEGNFQFPKDHPRHKFITDMAFTVSALLGVGYAILSMEGEKQVNYAAPKIDYGGTYAQLGVSTGTTGVGGPSAPAALAQVLAATTAAGTDKLINSKLSHSVLSLLMMLAGISPNVIRDNALNVSGILAGSAGGIGGQETNSRKTSPWESMPGALKPISGTPSFLTYWGEGIIKIIDLIYAFTPYRQYALQQVSHCFYNKFASATLGDMRRAIEHESYLEPELQEFTSQYRINNIYRSRAVAIKLVKDLALPYKQVDDTQALYSDVWDRVANPTQWTEEEYINSTFTRPASSHYVALKQRLSNQYGQIDGIIQVPVSTDYTDVVNSKSPVLFNGDIYIGRYTEKNTMFFFYDWLKGQPDGTTYNYKLRKMITHPRFWMDTDPFDVGEFVSSLGTLFNPGNNIPGNFDVYMQVDPNGLPCDCNDQSNCYFSQADVQYICEKEEELYQLELYLRFIEECACYINQTEEPECNGPNPVGNSDYAGCNNTYTPGCSACPDWSSLTHSNDYNAGQYLQENRGKWARKVELIKRKIENVQKKLIDRKEQLYNDYIDSLTGEDTSWLDNIFSGLVTPGDKYAFDSRIAGTWKFNVKQAFMYLFNSGVRDFFVESEINLDHRDWGDKPEERHYDYIEHTNLKELFSTDLIRVGNYMKYDYSLSISKLFNNFVSWGLTQRRDYNPTNAENCFMYRPKRVLYSLPQHLENAKDNWRIFLPLNYQDFNSPVSAIKPIGKSGAIMLFQNESPLQIISSDTLETGEGTKITIGDGGLFKQPLNNLVNAEYPHEYASCQNRLSVVNTPIGMYYINQNQGKIFRVGEYPEEISSRGMKWWFAKYLPYKLIEHPTFQNNPFQLLDNPVVGIGCQTIYDNENGIVFFCKKDWVIREDIADEITYVSGREFLVNKILKVELGDPRYFAPASWTISWDPKAQEGNGAWISFHDWHPDLTIPSKKTFMTTKKDGLWIHADRCDLFCNYYGIDYPFEVEYSVQSEGEVSTLRNILFLLETYVYKDNCDDRFHILDFGFDEAIVYNSEQCSGLLKLNLTPKNNAPAIITYPRVNFDNIEILYSKEEQKYRFNQFWDITADRGEFNPIAQRSIFLTEPNGYIKPLNLNNLNYNKSALERKKFRHYKHTILLRRTRCDNKNMIVAVALQTSLNSPR